MEYHELREQWIPKDANVLYEDQSHGEGSNVYVVFVYCGKLYIVRFFKLGVNWNASVDVERFLSELE